MTYNRGDVAWDIKGGALRPVIVLEIETECDEMPRLTTEYCIILRGTLKERVVSHGLYKCDAEASREREWYNKP